MIDWTKPVQTRDGRSVRILCTDGPYYQPVIGIVDGFYKPTIWSLEGEYYVGESHEHDLINVPDKRVAWVNIYANQSPTRHPTRQHADDVDHSSRIACIRVEYEVGQFDEDEI